ncbi:MAG TPA: tetratricopeptide repeat protein [Micromonosporaceae bacterium]
MSSEAPSGEAESVDGFIQRAQLLAELGRHDEAAAELGFAVSLDPDNLRALTVLAQVHLAADRPAEALAAAEAAAQAAPDAAYPMVIRALALVDLRRFGAAARIADELLARWPADAYAQRSAAGILGEARNGQPALNAAWRGVELAPTEAEAHLVLGLIAARLELFDLAERAYREALRLDPSLAEAGQDVGIIRLERRRYTLALAKLAELAGAEPAAIPSPAAPARAPMRHGPGDELRRLALWGAGYSIAAVVLTACVAAGNPAMSRIFAAVAAVAGLLMGWRFVARAPGVTGTRRSELLRGDRILAVSLYAASAGPLLILLYAVTGAPFPLVLALVGTAVAQLALLLRRR